MAHVLPVTALQVRDPVEPFVLVKTDDLSVQNASFRRFRRKAGGGRDYSPSSSLFLETMAVNSIK